MKRIYMNRYNKAIAALITSALGMLGTFTSVDVTWADPKVVGAVAVLITTALVWRIPNGE